MSSLLEETLKKVASVAENIRSPSELKQAAAGFESVAAKLPAELFRGGAVDPFQGGTYSFRGGAAIAEQSLKQISELTTRYEQIPDITIENPAVTATKIPIIDRSPLEIIPGYPTSVKISKDPLTEQDIFTAAAEGQIEVNLQGEIQTGEVQPPGTNEILLQPTIPGIPDIYTEGEDVIPGYEKAYQEVTGSSTMQPIELPSLPDLFGGLNEFFGSLGQYAKIGLLTIGGLLVYKLLKK